MIMYTRSNLSAFFQTLLGTAVCTLSAPTPPPSSKITHDGRYVSYPPAFLVACSTEKKVGGGNMEDCTTRYCKHG